MLGAKELDPHKLRITEWLTVGPARKPSEKAVEAREQIVRRMISERLKEMAEDQDLLLQMTRSGRALIADSFENTRFSEGDLDRLAEEIFAKFVLEEKRPADNSRMSKVAR